MNHTPPRKKLQLGKATVGRLTNKELERVAAAGYVTGSVGCPIGSGRWYCSCDAGCGPLQM